MCELSLSAIKTDVLMYEYVKHVDNKPMETLFCCFHLNDVNTNICLYLVLLDIEVLGDIFICKLTTLILA